MSDENVRRWTRRSALRAAGLTGIGSLFVGSANGSSDVDADTGSNEILVGIDDSVDVASAEPTLQQAIPAGGEIVHRNDVLGYVSVKLPETMAANEKATIEQQLQTRSDVDYVEDNIRVEAMEAAPGPDHSPSDPRLHDQYAPQQVNAPQAWSTTKGSRDVTIAILDTGVEYDHPDLAARFGQTKGYDVISGTGDPYPRRLDRTPDRKNETHGTHVAGIAAATTDNGTGIAGISNSTLLAGRVLDSSGGGNAAITADGIQWAAEQGADVINMSLGAPQPSQTMHNAVRYAANKGSLLVGSAGNDAERSVGYPAGFDEVVAVAGTNEHEQPYSGTNYGPEIDVCAPGQAVFSTWPDTPAGIRYNAISGTSMSAPVVSGVAALGLAANPELSATELRNHLEQTAVDIGLDVDYQGAGRVDAANLVDAVSGGGGGDETFPDVPEHHWAHGRIEALHDAGIISGYEDGSFRPQRTVTRAEFAAMLTTAFNLSGRGESFSDIGGHWASDQIRAASAAGFLSGYPDGTFRPDSEITRQEVLVSLSNALDSDSPIDVDEWLDQFDDGIDDWAREPIARMHRAGTLTNDRRLAQNANRLVPTASATRAEVANFLWNVLNRDAL